MKKTLLSTALTAVLLGSASQAMCEPKSYVGIDYQMHTLSASGMDDLEPPSFVFKLGSSLNQYTKLEGRFGRSLGDDNNDVTALKVDEIIGFYVKGGMDVMNMVFPYAVAGYSKVDLEFYGMPERTESDISYGVGADMYLDNIQVGVEWMMLQDKSDYQLETVSLSAAWRF